MPAVSQLLLIGGLALAVIAPVARAQHPDDWTAPFIPALLPAHVGDMAAHIFDPAYYALDLRVPLRPGAGVTIGGDHEIAIGHGRLLLCRSAGAGGEGGGEGEMVGTVRLAHLPRRNAQVHWPEGNALLAGGSEHRDSAAGIPEFQALVTIEAL